MAVQETPPTTYGPRAPRIEAVVDNVSRVVHGKQETILLAVVGLVAAGHLLVEDVPGVGKTTLARALARSLALDSRRVQCTPDLLPSDVTGAMILDRARSGFRFEPGPVFTNVLLVDEINRASPRTQSALLEAMEERQVTVAGTSRALPDPFLVIATQNPDDQEGAFPLPESQLDRFLLRLRLGYPCRDAEAAMLAGEGLDPAALGPVADAADLASFRADARAVRVASGLRHYLIDLAEATRSHPAVATGLSPRGTGALQAASRAMALARGRAFVVPDDVHTVAPAVMAHRLVCRAGAEQAPEVVDEVLRTVPIPLTAT